LTITEKDTTITQTKRRFLFRFSN